MTVLICRNCLALVSSIIFHALNLYYIDPSHFKKHSNISVCCSSYVSSYTYDLFPQPDIRRPQTLPNCWLPRITKDQETRSSRGLTSYSLKCLLIPQRFIRHGLLTVFKLQVSIPSSLKHHCRFMQMRHSATTSGECSSWLRPQRCWVLWMTAINAMNGCQLPTQPLLLFPAHTQRETRTATSPSMRLWLEFHLLKRELNVLPDTQSMWVKNPKCFQKKKNNLHNYFLSFELPFWVL